MPSNSAADEPSAATCVGCGGPLPAARYCPRCGQDERRRLITWSTLVGDAARNLVSLDGPVLHTLRGLATTPGAAVRAYLDTERRRYVSPFAFALVAGAAAVAVERRFAPAPTLPPDASPRLRAALRAQALVVDYSHVLTFVSLPVLALVLRALLRRAPRTAAEHYVFGLFVFGASFLLQAILSPLYLLAPRIGPYVVQAAPVAYLSWAAVGYLPGRPFAAVGIALVADVALYGVATLAGLGFILAYVHLS
ncbi:MAG: DUF3667 domain-containing protein [Planctomycetota bacterium]